MTQDEIIEMARQTASHGVENHRSGEVSYVFYNEHLTNFAKLVAQHEREQNAKICQELAKDMTRVGEFAAMLCAKLIRKQA